MSSSAVPNLQGVVALVVDDDADTREIFAMSLTHAGAKVEVAGSTAEALTLVRSGVHEDDVRGPSHRERLGERLDRRDHARKIEGQLGGDAVRARSRCRRRSAATFAVSVLGGSAVLVRMAPPGRSSSLRTAPFRQLA